MNNLIPGGHDENIRINQKIDELIPRVEGIGKNVIELGSKWAFYLDNFIDNVFRAYGIGV